MSKKVLIILTITLISILFLTGCLGKEFKQIEPSPLDELNQEDTGIESVIPELSPYGAAIRCETDSDCNRCTEDLLGITTSACVNSLCVSHVTTYCEVGETCSQAKCISDIDGDKIPDDSDNCPSRHNPEQEDSDENGVGDACEPTSSEVITIEVLDISGNYYPLDLFKIEGGKWVVNEANKNNKKIVNNEGNEVYQAKGFITQCAEKRGGSYEYIVDDNRIVNEDVVSCEDATPYYRQSYDWEYMDIDTTTEAGYPRTDGKKSLDIKSETYNRIYPENN